MADPRGSYRQRLGWRHESDACRYLRRRGLRLIARNYRCRGGEIDLVMRDGDVLVSVEVRYRRSSSHGGALASIDAPKQRRWLRATTAFLAERPEFAHLCVRFDVLAIDIDAKGRPVTSWLKDAFRPEG